MNANASVKKAAAKSSHKAAQMVPETKSPSNAKLSTDIHFDGLEVNGRRQSPFGASAVVENEKETPNLIDYRANYDDRVQRSQSGR
jgi:hypothetical protein